MEPRTLILNAWMSPHSIATWQQAICLLVTGKVDVLEAHEAEVSSPSVTIRIPIWQSYGSTRPTLRTLRWAIRLPCVPGNWSSRLGIRTGSPTP